MTLGFAADQSQVAPILSLFAAPAMRRYEQEHAGREPHVVE